MTRDEILALKAGPELDALVAEKVVGVSIVRENGVPVMEHSHHDPHLIGVGGKRVPPHPASTEMYWAWLVVGHLERRGMWWTAEYYQHDDPPYRWEFCNPIGKGLFLPYEAVAPTLPLAICRAALLTVMEVDA